MTHSKSVAAVTFASWIVIISGLPMFLALFTPVSAVLQWFTDLAYSPIGGEHPLDANATRLFVAIGGGVLVGWGVLLLLVAKRFYAVDSGVGRAVILPSILAWFIIDSTGSIMAGVWFNAVLNLSFLLIFAIPILAMKDASSAVR